MAYAALAIAFIGLVMMFAGVIYESNWRAMDCDDNDWPESTYACQQQCEQDRAYREYNRAHNTERYNKAYNSKYNTHNRKYRDILPGAEKLIRHY